VQRAHRATTKILIPLIRLIALPRRRYPDRIRGGASSAPRNDESAPFTVVLLDVAARPEAVLHLVDAKVMEPQQTEKATENLGHSSVPPGGVSYIDRSFVIKISPWER